MGSQHSVKHLKARIFETLRRQPSPQKVANGTAGMPTRGRAFARNTSNIQLISEWILVHLDLWLRGNGGIYLSFWFQKEGFHFPSPSHFLSGFAKNSQNLLLSTENALGPPAESLEYGYPFFSAVYFSRGTLAGDLVVLQAPKVRNGTSGSAPRRPSELGTGGV